MAGASHNETSLSFDERLEQAKLEAMKELAYGASHEINNPLANISARAQTLLRDERDPERRRALLSIHQQALRAHEMISDLMLFARPPRLDYRPTNIAATIEDVLTELRPDCERRAIALSSVVAEGIEPVDCDPIQLAVSLKALCQNAVDAIGERGEVQVSASSIPLSSSGDGEDSTPLLRIEVTDSGPGVSPRIRPRIFDPFFSGREAGRGLGFGLSKAWRIVSEHGGHLRLDETCTSGARFIIELPISAPPR